MKICGNCEAGNPDSAQYCMQCGSVLPARGEEGEFIDKTDAAKGISTFTFSIIASILLSLLLILVFRMPIFILAGLLPLFWLKRKKR